MKTYTTCRVLAATSHLNLPQNFNLTLCFTPSYNSDLYQQQQQQQQAAGPHQIQGNEVSTPAISQQKKAAPPHLSTRAFILVNKPLFASGDARGFVISVKVGDPDPCWPALSLPWHQLCQSTVTSFTCHRIVTQHTHCAAGIASTRQSDVVIELNNGDAH